MPDLTQREREVLRLLAHGNTAKQAGRALGISYHTVKDRAKAARLKLGAITTAQAVAFGLAQGVI